LGGSRIYGYSNIIGFLAHPPGPSTIMYTNIMMADNERGLGLRVGHDGDNNTAFLRDSWVSAIARPGCPYCYGNNATKCSSNYGLRLFVATPNG
jgi:hypothetical protein